MADTSQVSIPRATYHYFTSVPNLILVGGAACFLGKHAVSYLGKDCANFPALEKIPLNLGNYLAFYDFASGMKATHSLFSIISDGMSVVKGQDQESARTRRKGDMPRGDHSYIGVKTWMAYKSAASLFKIVSSILLVRETLRQLGVINGSFSPTVRAGGLGLGALGYVIDIIDTQRAINDHDKDVADGVIPTDKKIKEFKADDKNIHQVVRQIAEDKNLHRAMLQNHRRYNQVIKALIIGVEVVGVIKTLAKIEVAGLIGRVSRFAVDHGDTIYGTLFTAMSVTGLVQHALYGATIQQLERRDVNPKVKGE